jgi:hypothetical protein
MSASSQENNSGDVNGVRSSEMEGMIPVKEFVSAMFAKGCHQTSTAFQNFTALERQFPNNIYLLLIIANLQVSCLHCFWHHLIDGSARK